jgi:hypothetical protein
MYSLCNDTSVNTASRMESHSEANRINCSESTALLLRAQCPELLLKSRGLVDVKGKGRMLCYWVNEEGHGRTHKRVLQTSNAGKVTLEPLDEESSEFDVESSSEFEDTMLSSSRSTSARHTRPHSISQNTDHEPLEESRKASEHWYDEEAAILSTPEIPQQKTGPFAKLMDQGQKWLRLNEERCLFDDEVSV